MYRYYSTSLIPGWSDMFYVPKTLWKPFIELINLFKKHNVWCEIAVPTVMNILQNEYPMIDFEIIKDCKGSCCESFDFGRAADISSSRCGHRLMMEDEKASHAHFARLEL